MITLPLLYVRIGQPDVMNSSSKLESGGQFKILFFYALVPTARGRSNDY
jgi:hypothetical protein